MTESWRMLPSILPIVFPKTALRAFVIKAVTFWRNFTIASVTFWKNFAIFLKSFLNQPASLRRFRFSSREDWGLREASGKRTPGEGGVSVPSPAGGIEKETG